MRSVERPRNVKIPIRGNGNAAGLQERVLHIGRRLAVVVNLRMEQINLPAQPAQVAHIAGRPAQSLLNLPWQDFGNDAMLILQKRKLLRQHQRLAKLFQPHLQIVQPVASWVGLVSQMLVHCQIRLGLGEIGIRPVHRLGAVPLGSNSGPSTHP